MEGVERGEGVSLTFIPISNFLLLLLGWCSGADCVSDAFAAACADVGLELILLEAADTVAVVLITLEVDPMVQGWSEDAAALKEGGIGMLLAEFLFALIGLY